MGIHLKNESEIAKMKIAGGIIAEAFELLRANIQPNITTKELDSLVEAFVKSKGGILTFKNYNGFPGNICISINEEVIHGIPGKRKLADGDIVGIDIGVTHDGMIADAARTFLCGNVAPEVVKLVEETENSFFEAMKVARAGHHLYEISAAIGDYANALGYGVVKDFIGHGVGKKLHEEPEVPNYRQQRRGPKLVSGMTLAIEPMINLGDWRVDVLSDDWTVVTRDRKASAHYENTIVIRDGEPEIITLAK